MSRTYPTRRRRPRIGAVLLILITALLGAVAFAKGDPGPGRAGIAAAQPQAATTNWCTVGVEIHVAQNGACSASSPQFFASGVDYEPTQIGGSATISPYNDLFWDNSDYGWNQLWNRDINLMRTIGFNSIRTYGWWKWEPNFYNGVELYPFWNQLDWSTSDSGPFSDNGNQPALFPHNSHNTFLDRMWNGGANPIYVWIGISIDEKTFDGTAQEKTNRREFLKRTAQWAAQKYGNHPAVVGFVIGNEVDLASFLVTSDYWDYLNGVGAAVKAIAPNKLTMTVFHDIAATLTTTITSGQYAGKKTPQAYKQDVWGINPYNDPRHDGNILPRYRAAVYDLSKQVKDPTILKPLLFTEGGVPGNTHSSTGQVYPACWFPNPFPAPPPFTCNSGVTTSPPGSPDGNAIEQPTTDPAAGPDAGPYKLPPALQGFFPYIDPNTDLPGAPQAWWDAKFWRSTRDSRANNNAIATPGNLSFASGAYIFEWQDEWWKVGSRIVQDTCTGCNSNIFAGGWADEDWWGLFSHEVDGRPCTNLDDCAPIDPATGRLRGNADKLRPRAAVVALYNEFHALPPSPSPSPTPTPTPTSKPITPTPPPTNGPTPSPSPNPPTPSPSPNPPTPSPSPNPPTPSPVPGGLSAVITGCTAQGGGVYSCTLQVTLGNGAMLNSVLNASISGASYNNPTKTGRPTVASSPGCANPPIPSEYHLEGGSWRRFDANISSGGCSAGAVVTFTEAVAGSAGAMITQTVSGAGLGMATTPPFTLPMQP